MTTPNPQGTTRCKFWDYLAAAKPAPSAHWSYDTGEARKSKGIARRAHKERLLANL